MQTIHRKSNSNLIKTQNEDKILRKYHISNASQDNKSSSLRILVTELNNGNYTKPVIRPEERALAKLKKNYRKIKDYENAYSNENINKGRLIKVHYGNKYKTNGSGGITSYKNISHKSKHKNNIKYRHQHYNKLVSQINSNDLSSNKHIKTKSNGDIMQLALSLLLDSNSTFSNKNNNTYKNNNSKKDFKQHQNANTNFNININNQININTNTNTGNSNKNIKDNFNHKIKHLENGLINFRHRANYISTGGNFFSGSNYNCYTFGKKQCKKSKSRNIYSGIKKGKTCNNYNSDKIIKSYHTKSLSSLTDLINNNKKLMTLYKSISKSKYKEK